MATPVVVFEDHEARLEGSGNLRDRWTRVHSELAVRAARWPVARQEIRDEALAHADWLGVWHGSGGALLVACHAGCKARARRRRASGARGETKVPRAIEFEREGKAP